MGSLTKRAWEGMFSNTARLASRAARQGQAPRATNVSALGVPARARRQARGRGARDLDVARSIARARWKVQRIDELVRIGLLVPREVSEMLAASELLFRVRNLLHATPDAATTGSPSTSRNASPTRSATANSSMPSKPS